MPDPPVPDEDAVVSWLRSRARRLDGVQAGASRADLAGLAAVWADVDVLGLGESTHGTREFFTLKHRLIEFLVLELDLRVVAMEASESAATVVDDYVTHGRGAARPALAGLQFWTWNTGEVLAMLEWLRRHNADLPEERRVRFAGVDPQRPATAVAVVERFLGESAPRELDRFAGALRELRSHRMTEPPLRADVRDRVAELVALLDRDDAALAGTSSAGGVARARRHAGFLLRSATLATAELSTSGPTSVYAVRDRLMADAVIDALPGAGERRGLPVALWAHNGHLSRGGPSSATATTGAHLSDRLGSRYYALGLTTGAGRFHARRKRLLRGLTAGPVAHRLGRAPRFTVEGRLAAATPADHLVDLRDADAPEPVGRWLGTPALTRSFGAVASILSRVAFAPVSLAAEFDGIAYVHRSTPPTPCREDAGGPTGPA